MNVYLFMGTHLPEVRQCLRFLAGAEDQDRPVELQVPAGLGWPLDDPGFARTSEYDAANAHWVLNPDADETAFIVLDPRQSPVQQLVRLAGDLGKCLIEPVKVVTCVDCSAAEQNAPLRAWYEACVYYSDIVLLGNRGGASKHFVHDYQKHFEKECFPCLFLFLKGPGNPDQPLEVLAPDTRRLSQLFDLGKAEPEEASLPGLVIEASCDLDLEEAELDPYRQGPDQEAPQAHVPDATPFIVPIT